MSRRVAGLGSLLLAGLLLGSLGLAAPAAGQQQEDPLTVVLRGSEASSGRLKVTVGMSGPGWTGGRLGPGDVTATIDGQPVQRLQATPLQEQQGARGQLAVILAVDTSGSMLQFDNIARARQAAARFAAEMPPGTRVGVVSFADQPRVEQALTPDRARVQQVIEGLQADPRGDTALYDAVVEASRLLAGEPGQRNLVVLSDGRHEGTPTSLQQAIAAAEKAKVITDTFGLEVPGFEQDQAALGTLAARTGGRALKASAENLEGLFGAAGRKLASQYVVDLALPPGVGSEVDFRLTVRANGEVGEYHNQRFFVGTQASPAAVPIPAELPRAPALSRLESDQGRYIVAVAGFAALLLVGLLLFGPGSRSARPYRALRQRLSPYSLTAAISDDRAARPSAFGSSEWAGRATAMAETLVRRGNLEETFLDRMEAAGLNMRVAEFVLISLGSAFIPPLLVLILTQNLLLAVLTVVLGTVGPFLYLAVMASRRQAKFDEQLPSTLQLLSGALQAGHSLQQAVDTVVHEAADPIAGEFQRVLTEARLGRPLEEAFEAMAKRTRSLDFEWTVMAIRLQRQVGGNLAEVLSTVSQTIRDRYSLKRQIRALSAEGRLSSLILSILPVLLFAALLAFNPLFLRPLFTTTAGIAMMVGAAVLMLFGVFWLKKITEIKV
jgi:tight adherence protein B